MKKSLVLVVVLSLGLVVFAHAGILTHQLANPAETVMLRGVLSENEASKGEISEFQRVLWDGTTEATNYRIPPNKALVITDVDFQVWSRDTVAEGSRGSVSLYIDSFITTSGMSLAATIGFQIGKIADIGESHNMNTGMIVHNGARIVASVNGPNPDWRFGLLVLRGYLVTVPKGPQ